VVGNVDKTFLDYIIIAKTKGPKTAFCGFSYPKKIFFFHTITFSGQEEFHYEKSHETNGDYVGGGAVYDRRSELRRAAAGQPKDNCRPSGCGHFKQQWASNIRPCCTRYAHVARSKGV
jgi:hypothetical protein